MALAFVAAAGLHALALGFIPRASQRPEATAGGEIVTVAFRPKPPPTPTPTATPAPRPTPKQTLRTAALARPPTIRRSIGAVAAAPAPHRPLAAARSVVPIHAAQPGAAKSAAAEGSGGSAAEGSAGDGSASGAASASAAGTAAPAPCGVVIVTELATRYRPDGSHTATIRLEVTLSDGSVVADDLGWPFVYAHDSDDPFTPAGKADQTPILLQPPPPGYDLAAQQPATVFAVRHTDAQGYTDLTDCPPRE
jgi:hypothetical protein